MYTRHDNAVLADDVSVTVQPSIALVDDDRNILPSVTMTLKAEGFKVRSFEDGTQALRFLSQTPVDLVVLDIKMPRLDGLEVLKRLRKISDTPAIFLTSKDDDIDEVLGLKMGADDYVRKPFSHRLLIERIRAVLRRVAIPAGSGVTEKPLVRGHLVLDPARHLCTWRDRPVVLTVTEFLILKALAQHPGHVKGRDALLTAAYPDNINVEDRTIDSHIKRMRKKFREVDPDFDSIETLYALGYRYNEAG